MPQGQALVRLSPGQHSGGDLRELTVGTEGEHSTAGWELTLRSIIES